MILDVIDQDIRERSLAEWDAIPGPRVGDFVEMLDGTTRRFTHHWGDGIQTTYYTKERGHWDASFYFGREGYVSFSGSLDKAIPLEKLQQIEGGAKPGNVWFFHHNEMRAHNGVYCTVPCRIFRQLP